MRKVSLREIVADKIVFAILIALYYWMWARNDWHNYYTSIQYAVFAFTFFYFISRASRLRKYKQELPDEMSENADYLLASEVAGAGVILFSKVQEATEQEIERTKAHIGRAMQRIKCDRQLADVMICKDWALLKEEDYQKIMTSGYQPADHVKLSGEQDGFESVYFLNLGMTEEKMRQTVSAVLQDAECGKIFRVKGFIRKDDKWLELNAMQDAMTVKEVEKGQEVLIVIGEELNEEKIRTYFGQKELTL